LFVAYHMGKIVCSVVVSVRVVPGHGAAKRGKVGRPRKVATKKDKDLRLAAVLGARRRRGRPRKVWNSSLTYWQKVLSPPRFRR